jgi:hypothetical protein
MAWVSTWARRRRCQPGHVRRERVAEQGDHPLPRLAIVGASPPLALPAEVDATAEMAGWPMIGRDGVLDALVEVARAGE